MKRCIYCDTDKDLTISHIVPDALTNANLTNSAVCKTDDLTNFRILIDGLKRKDKASNYKTVKFLELLRNNIEKNLARSYIHLKALKMFVKEHLPLENEIKLNLNNSNPYDFYFYFIIMRIGEDKPEQISKELLDGYNRELLFNNAFIP